MSYEEQQSDEMDALQAIYPSEFKLISSANANNSAEISTENEILNKFSIKITNESDNDNDCDNYELELSFELPKNYPDVGPIIEIVSSKNLEDCDELKILDILNDLITENLGTVMVFTMITTASDWLSKLKETKIIERKMEEERRKKELEEMERRKFEGTRVTVETFIAWKMKFDAEMAAEAAKNKESVKKDSEKLTGKEMFMRDKNLIDSDLNFIDTITGDDGAINDVDVKVDESLFQDDDNIDDDELID